MDIAGAFMPLVDLFFPKLCIACEEESYAGDIPVCVKCLVDLPLADMDPHKDNLITERLYGRFPIQSSAALLYFTKKSKTQHLIHHAKYSGDPQISRILGNWLGESLQAEKNYSIPDVIVPVPLHDSKMSSRGYNQSQEFGQGLAEIFQITCIGNALKRTQASISQTTKNRMDRLENVHSSFDLYKTDGIVNKHILLVDDVLTTGATIEACAEKLLTLPNTKISICLMAIVVE